MGLASAHAAVRVITGPTPIVDGEARAAGDITVINDKLAFALAIDSGVPYGVPRGALVDLAPVENGVLGRDRAVFADFIPNNWSAWPNTYHRLEILEQGPEQVVLRVTRDFSKATVSTVYTLRDHSDQVEIVTTSRNDDVQAMPALLSGLTLWPKGGYLFGVPGLEGMTRAANIGSAALSDRVVAYDADWMLALHAPYADQIDSGGKDMFQLHTLGPGESRRFAGVLQVGPRGDLAPVIGAEIARRHSAFGSVHGSVRGVDGALPAQAVVVAELAGKPFGWALAHNGHYTLALPAGDYALYATATGHAQSAPISVTVAPQADLAHDFGPLAGPGKAIFTVTGAGNGKRLDARIAIVQGQQPLVGYLGKKTFFTELDRRGVAELALAPGAYRFAISAGGGFLNEAQQVDITVAPGATQTAQVRLAPFADPAARHWYSADLHHHADQAEASTPPADLARAQLAAGLDVLFVSDHDSMVNLPVLQRIAQRRGMAFIGSIELSPSWGHFNAYPIAPGQRLRIDTGKASVSELFREARRLGALAVQVNHPLIPYGYFTSVDAKLAPGGFEPRFDLVEFNAAAMDDDTRLLQRLWTYWNARRPYYLSAGTDTHDVWNGHSGKVRSIAHVPGKLTGERFTRALKAGHAYVSAGPLIFPDTVFGSTLKVAANHIFVLGFQLQSLAGIKQVELIGAGLAQKRRAFEAGTRDVHVDFPLRTGRATWYSLMVEDNDGRKAYTNPIWVDVTTPARR
ncbi:MAG: CehA/McbA family metallohydrolase [Massilia sp.]|nr:CehA/McbA family metallohydrolase [Massilia sp.]